MSDTRWELVAGHPALDFVNTVDDRLSSHPVELVRGPDDLAAWAIAAGLLPTAPSPSADAGEELALSLRLRHHLASLLDAVVTHRSPRDADLQAVAREVAAAYGTSVLACEDGRLRWCWEAVTIGSVRHRIAVTAVELLSGPEASRIRRCAGQDCGWFFLDTTKRGNRRWCSMRTCGQQAKNARRRRESSA